MGTDVGNRGQRAAGPTEGGRTRASMANKPVALLVAAAAVMTAGSFIRWGVTKSIKVDQNYLSGLPGVVSVVLFLVSLAIAGFAYVKIVLRRDGYDLDPRQTRNAAVAVVLISFFMMPMVSNDIFTKLATGDIVIHGFNPYTRGDALKTSAYAPYLGAEWIDAPYVEGPVSLGLGVLAAVAGRGSVWISLAVFKLLILGFGLLLIAAAHAFFRQRDSGAAWNGEALVVLSPLVWIQGTGQSHGDIVAAALLMTALLLLARRRFLAASLPLALAVLTKSFVAIAVPAFLILAWWGLEKERKKRVIILAACLGIMALCTAAVYAPLPDPAGSLRTSLTFLAHKSPSKSVTQVLTEAAVFIGKQIRPLAAGDAAASGRWVAGLGTWVGGTVKVLSLALAAWVLFGLRRARGFGGCLTCFAALAAILICFYSPVFQPWYLLSFLPLFAGVERRTWIVWAAVVFAFANAMNAAHIVGLARARSWGLTGTLVFGTILLFFWRSRSRFFPEADAEAGLTGS